MVTSLPASVVRVIVFPEIDLIVPTGRAAEVCAFACCVAWASAARETTALPARRLTEAAITKRTGLSSALVQDSILIPLPLAEYSGRAGCTPSYAIRGKGPGQRLDVFSGEYRFTSRDFSPQNRRRWKPMKKEDLICSGMAEACGSRTHPRIREGHGPWF